MDPKLRRQVLRLLSNGIYVVTARNGGAEVGATITWLTQASFEPPLLVAGVRPGSAISAALRAGGAAVVHVLGVDQQDVARRFFTPAAIDDDAAPPTINDLPFEPTGYGPRLLAARAWADCRVRETIDCGGDHRLVVLEVEDVGSRGEVDPLTVRRSPWQYGG